MGSERVCPTVEAIAAYVEGRLAGSELDDVEAHLDVCSACARVVVEAAGSQRSGRPARVRPRIFSPGQVVAGRYEIIDFLGAGGMGEVYEAQDRELGDRIALKTISAAISLDGAVVNRFKAEAQLARKVTHRNVCRIFDLGIHLEAAGDATAPCLTPFLTMELIRGQSLSEHMRGGRRFNADEATGIARQIARGLEAAHEAGVLHRDLKSDNVLLVLSSTETFRAIITDFGLAAAATIGDGADAVASSGVLLYGTRPYLAPERFAGAPATAASDIYSLGVVMHELVTGSLTAASQSSPAVDGLPPSLAHVILRCLAREPARRPASAAEVSRMLDDNAAQTSASRGEALRDSDRARGRTRRRVWLAFGSAASFAVAASLFLVTDIARSRSSERSARSSIVTHEVAPTATSSPAVALVESSLSAARPEPRSRGTRKAKLAVSTVQELLASAERRLRGGQLEEACVAGREAVARAPKLAAAWEFLGRCYMRLGQSEEAREYYRRYLTLAPSSPKAPFIRAIVDEDEP